MLRTLGRASFLVALLLLAASPVPAQSRPMTPMMLDATFVSCAVRTASVIVSAARPLSPPKRCGTSEHGRAQRSI